MMKRKTLQCLGKFGGVICGTMFLVLPIREAEAAMITGPHNFTQDTVLTVPSDYFVDPGFSTYSVIRASGSSQTITSENNVKVTIVNNNTDTSDGKKWEYGIEACNGGTISLDQVAITGSSWAGLAAEGGSITVGDDLNIDVYQASGDDQSYGIRVNRYATATASVTVGDNAHIRSTGDCIWVNNANGSVVIGNNFVADSTQFLNENAITAVSGSVQIGDSATITASGVGTFASEGGTATIGNNAKITGTSQGVYAYNNGVINIGDKATLTSDGQGAIARTGGTINIGDGAEIKGRVQGVYAYTNSTATLGDNEKITSNGQGVLAKDSSHVNIGNSAIINASYAGTSYNAYGIIGILALAEGYVSVDNNLSLTSEGYGILASGESATIDIKDGAVLSSNMAYKNGQNMSVVYASTGGTVSLKSATISMDNATSTANAIGVATNGAVNGIGVYDINGNIKAKTEGTVDLAMQAGSKFKGISQLEDTVSTINLTLTSSEWSVTGTSSLTNLVNNNSTLDMTSDNNLYSTLTVNNLSGTGGTFILDVDGTKNVDNSDRIYVADTFTGTQNLALNEKNGRASDKTLGQDAAGTILASVNNGAGTFVAADGEGTLYWKRYILDTEASSTSGYTTDWYLKAIENTGEVTTTVSSVMRAASSSYNMWRDNDQIMLRLGDLRKDGKNQEGVWVRIKGVKSSRNGIYSLKNEYKQYQVGYDSTLKKTKDYVRYGGFAFGYSDGDVSYTDGSGKNRERALTLYQTELRNSGHYLDMVLKAGRLNGDFSAYDSYKNKITGDHGATGVSFGVEYGRKKQMTKDGWYLEPQFQMTFGRLLASEYTLNNGVQVSRENTDSALGRIGVQVGKDIDPKTNIYAKVNVLHEFAGNAKVRFVDGDSNNTVSDDLSGTWAEYGIGTDIKVGKDSRIYFDISKGIGGEFKKTWQWNLGARWSF